MKILIVDTYYSGFLKSIYESNASLANKSYETIRKHLLSQSFGTSDYYSYYLNKLGHNAYDVIINDEVLQKKWANERGIVFSGDGIFSKIQMLPLLHRFIGRPKWVQDIALAQIKSFKPDVVYMQDLSILNPSTLKEVKNYCKLLVGQIACPLPSEENLKQFDLILTSFPHFVPMFKKMGIKSEYFKISFDPRVLKKVGPQSKKYDVTFVGSFSPHHRSGTKLLEEIAKEIPINIWGQGLQYLSINSPLRKKFHGEAWGYSMYKVLAQSKIVINRHISVAKNNANNMRLFESTGMGAMLITDHKKNLKDLFRIGEEVVEYRNSKELIEKIQYYLDHESERERIARNGQKRTLKDYTYDKRMKELVKIIKKYI